LEEGGTVYDRRPTSSEPKAHREGEITRGPLRPEKKTGGQPSFRVLIKKRSPGNGHCKNTKKGIKKLGAP